MNDNKYIVLEYSFNTKIVFIGFIKKLINLNELTISDKKIITHIYKLYERNN